MIVKMANVNLTNIVHSKVYAKKLKDFYLDSYVTANFGSTEEFLSQFITAKTDKKETLEIPDEIFDKQIGIYENMAEGFGEMGDTGNPLYGLVSYILDTLSDIRYYELLH